MNEKNKNTFSKKDRAFEPVTIEELHKEANKRVSLINQEFKQGFEFLINHPKSVTFFGSARLNKGDIYYEKARSISAKIVHALGYSIITGGGPGIMEASNKGAFEAKGKSLGLNIKLPHEQISNPYLTNEMSFHYFFSRKVCLSFSAEAYVFFPGGFGTLDEFTEILTLIQTNKIEKVPIILVGNDFWNNFDTFIKENLLKNKLIDPGDINLYTITEDETKIIEIIRKAPIKNGVPLEI